MFTREQALAALNAAVCAVESIAASMRPSI
jgi:hypothetical protein